MAKRSVLAVRIIPDNTALHNETLRLSIIAIEQRVFFAFRSLACSGAWESSGGSGIISSGSNYHNIDCDHSRDKPR